LGVRGVEVQLRGGAAYTGIHQQTDVAECIYIAVFEATNKIIEQLRRAWPQRHELRKLSAAFGFQFYTKTALFTREELCYKKMI
jgi:hypothetical protein